MQTFKPGSAYGKLGHQPKIKVWLKIAFFKSQAPWNFEISH